MFRYLNAFYLNLKIFIVNIFFFLCRATEIDAENHIAAIIGSAETAESTKGVSVSHAALMDIATCDSVTENDVTFTSTTLFWLSGIYMLLSSTIFGAKRIITNTTFSPEYLAELIEKYKVRTIS